ncbi:putative 1-acyl-sn-glycerol-3-phosphate acyltransferase 5 [Acorus calamus]|uniref:1-acylglycerol-3-phosphate O-acyltransferase n=1 Tax=Acorus calamus TaxID=4465 RepID=A0AAV9EW11_ACOCL|nr:putative 1-acyl-sn-glycerol-3-phosphate acyltransferase 5 [Acorus calamus]
MCKRMNKSNATSSGSKSSSSKQLDSQEPPKHGTKHRPLTPLRILRGVLCLVVFLSTAFMMLVYWAPVTAVMLRFFSVHYSRKATSILFGSWLALWPFLFEKINKTKVVFSGEAVPRGERVLLFSNHRTEVDWMYVWDLALRKGQLGYIKYILKSSLMKLPVFGWGFHILEFISVKRKWEVDELNMRQMLSTFKDPQDPLWLVVFPEGTDYTEKKCIRSQQFAAENGLPILNNVLLPKTKGFYASLHSLRSSLDAVYDVTIAYNDHCCPCFMDNVFGVDPSEVHIHIQRVPLDQIPTSEEGTATWLMEAFRLKDQLLSDFYAQGHFPVEGTEGDLSMLKCLIDISVIIALTSICTYLTFFSFWFKIYVTSACACLASSTYFNIRPSPVLFSLKTLFGSKNTS